MKYLICGTLVMVFGLMQPLAVYAQQGQLTGNHVRVRTSPSLETDDNILFQVNEGQMVDIVDIYGSFYRVNVRDYRDVYIYREFVSRLAAVEEVFEEIYEEATTYEVDITINEELTNEIIEETITEETVVEENIAEETAAEEIIIEDMPVPEAAFNDTRFEICEEEAAFVEAVLASRANGLADEIIAYAKTYIGVPYRFGSTDPSRGFDCSGFVTVVMRNFGISLQRSSASMAATNGTRVDRNALQPGDLVFFATGGGGRVSHVGIYIGGNRFIHSASCRGVIISGMEDPGYRGRFVRANRVI